MNIFVPASLAIVAASLFALQTDDRASSFVITRGEAFYMQVSLQILFLSLYSCAYNQSTYQILLKKYIFKFSEEKCLNILTRGISQRSV